MKTFVFSTALAAAANLNAAPHAKGSSKHKSVTEGLRAKVKKIRENSRKRSNSAANTTLTRSAK